MILFCLSLTLGCKMLTLKIFCFNVDSLIFVIPRNEESPQVTPQRESNLCRASRGDSSFLGMTKLCA